LQQLTAPWKGRLSVNKDLLKKDLFIIKEKLSNGVRTLAFMGTLMVTFEERNTLIFFCVSLRTFFV